MQFDLAQLADRLTAAKDRISGLSIEVSATDLILVKDGHGTGRSESFPFTALFLRPDDVLAQALDRLQNTNSRED